MTSYGDMVVMIIGLSIGLSYGVLSPKLSFFKKNPRYEQMALGMIAIFTGTMLFIWYFNDF